MAEIEFDKRHDIFPSAVLIDRISIVGRIQKEFFNTEFLSKSGTTGRPRKELETCKGGHRRNSIPDESSISSCSSVENNGVCGYRKNSLSPFRETVFWENVIEVTLNFGASR